MRICKDLSIITIFYLLTHSLMLFINGVWWDDWIFLSSNNIYEAFCMQGRPIDGYILNLYINVFGNNTFVHKICVFLFYYIATIFLYGILRKIKEIPDTGKIFIPVIFCIFFVNDARITFNTFPYAISNVLFFGAFLLFTYLFEAQEFMKKLFIRLFAMLLFFFTFTTNSFLVYYWIIFAYIYYKEKNVRRLVHYCDFIFLPFIYFYLKMNYFPVYGIYSNYNIIHVKNLLFSIISLPVGLYASYVYNFIKIVCENLGILCIIIVICLLFYNKLSLNIHEFVLDKKDNKILIFIGVVILSLGIYPYMVVFGPTIFMDNQWSNRHLLLAPLGISWITYFLACYFIRNRKVLILSMTIFCILNIVQWNKQYIKYQLDYYKQLSIVELIKNNDIIKNNDNFIFVDFDRDKNVNYNSYRYYVLTEIFNNTFNSNNKLVIPYEEYNINKDYDKYKDIFLVYHKKNV